LTYDVRLEDVGDDLRLGILNLRDAHRAWLFEPGSAAASANLDRAYAQVLEDIDELEAVGVRDPSTPQPRDLRLLAQGYQDALRAIRALNAPEPAALADASTRGLAIIAQLDTAAQPIDKLAEQRASVALESVRQATASAQFVLAWAICGLIIVGGVLTMLVVRTVGDMRRLYAGERLAAESLARLAQAKAEFLADVSHELRTPLTVVRANADVGLLLQSHCAHTELLKEVARESARMTRMVDDLLFLAWSDAATPPLTLELVAAAPFLAELAGRAEALVRERAGVLRLSLRAEVDLRIDAERIEQAVLVAVDNAAKFGPRGGCVYLGAAQDDAWLRIDVVDHGSGIDPNDQPHLFDRFYRAEHAGAARLEGAGLGLAIAKTIVEAHGGTIRLESKLGQGTRVEFCLPAVRTASEAAP
jgi:signal transduction histidine kinase